MYQSNNNISLSEKIVGTYYLIKTKFNWFRDYTKTFEKPESIAWKVFYNRFPIEARLIDGTKINIRNKDEASLYCFLKNKPNLEYFPEDDLITIPLPWDKNKKIKLFGITKGIDALLTFTKNGIYEELNVENKTVIDVGANIGDTPMYFVLRGAKKVIGIEPFLQNYKLAIKNLETNDCIGKTDMLLAGCSSKSSHILIDPNFSSDIRSTLQNFEKGMSIPLLTLEEIVTKNKITDGILKMDCEGCEYESILSASSIVLEKFTQIQIEYHNGYNNLKYKLEACNFKVRSIIIDTPYRGHIVAVRLK